MLNIPDPKKLAAAFGSVQKIPDSAFKAVHKLLGFPMTEDELYLKLSDPKLTPEEKKRIQEQYNNEHAKTGTYGTRD